MADAAKVQGVTVANLAKMWGTTVANIAKVMGVNINAISGTLTAGTPVVFESASTYDTSVCLMDSTHAIVVYVDGGNSNYVTACCLSISGTTVTAGTPYSLDVGISYGFVTDRAVCKLDSATALLVFGKNTTPCGYAVVLSLSGTTITAGTPVSIYSTDTSFMSVCALSSTKVIVAWRTTDGVNFAGRAACLVISGTSITTVGTAVIFESGEAANVGICSMDSTHAIIVCTDLPNAQKGTAVCMTLSGETTLTKGTSYIFETGATGAYVGMSVCSLSSSKAIVAYRDAGNSNYGTVCGLSLSGSTITVGTPVVFESASSDYFSICPVDSTHAIVAYRDVANTNYGTACYITLSGTTTLTAGTPAVFESANSLHVSIAMIDATHAIVVYRDAGNSNYGTSVCLTLS